MLNLQLATDPFWVKNVVEGNLEALLSDHAYCEQKAASNAITLITLNPDRSELVTAMAALAQEEMDHFQRVHEHLLKRGFKLGWDKKDAYVNELARFMRKGGSAVEQLTERLLFAAMIEARSCERFKVLAAHIEDEELAGFYRELMASEANHYMLFIKLAKKYADGLDIDSRWKEWLEFEGTVITRYGKTQSVHG
ncbi:tRNA 2-methylthio-N6-isopentenyl adenosine(37) hydroxylase MiaE [Pedobacter yulinensis]|uniref:tRNA 2-methylthio-N6-isopentenyl adenosine(37) hydroxylase MiaE n=1 Tax=Pedobacter yulinensis TaxID=2126353 RepID=A0A2T3HS55_9SPHI|nr:tRNA 2-methylthio-N6-isopentenyl adenosine(37) hydroxylase MiaE [Pedobacter yulinensis]